MIAPYDEKEPKTVNEALFGPKAKCRHRILSGSCILYRVRGPSFLFCYQSNFVLTIQFSSFGSFAIGVVFLYYNYVTYLYYWIIIFLYFVIYLCNNSILYDYIFILHCGFFIIMYLYYCVILYICCIIMWCIWYILLYYVFYY